MKCLVELVIIPDATPSEVLEQVARKHCVTAIGLLNAGNSGAAVGHKNKAEYFARLSQEAKAGQTVAEDPSLSLLNHGQVGWDGWKNQTQPNQGVSPQTDTHYIPAVQIFPLSAIAQWLREHPGPIELREPSVDDGEFFF